MVISMGEDSDGNEGMIKVQLTKEEMNEAYILMEPFIEGEFGLGELSSFDTTGGGTLSIKPDEVLLTNSKGTENLGKILGANVLDYLELIGGIDVPQGYISMPDSTGPAENDVSPINSGSTDTQKGHLYRFLNGIGKCKPVAIGAGVGVGVLYLAGQILSGIGGDNNAHDAANMNNSINDIVDEVNRMIGSAGDYSLVGSAAAAPEAQEDNADVADQGKPDLVVKNAKIVLDNGEYYMDITVENQGDAKSPISATGIGAWGRSSGETHKELRPDETEEVRYKISTVCDIEPDTPIEDHIDALYAKADIWNKIEESNEDNNIWKFTEEDIPKQVHAASGNSQAGDYSNNGGAEADQGGKGPDLAVMDTKLEEIDGEFVITATIENTGDEPVGNYYVGIDYYDNTGRIGRTIVKELAPDETRDVSFYPEQITAELDLDKLERMGIHVAVDSEYEKEESKGNNRLRVPMPGEVAGEHEVYPQNGDDEKVSKEQYKPEVEKKVPVAVQEEPEIPGLTSEEVSYNNGTDDMEPSGYSPKGIVKAAAGIGLAGIGLAGIGYGAYRAKKYLSGRKRDKEEELLPGEEELQSADTERAGYLSRAAERIKYVATGLKEKIPHRRNKDAVSSESEIGYKETEKRDSTEVPQEQVLFEDKDNIRDYQNVPGAEVYREKLDSMGMTVASEGDLVSLPGLGTIRIDIYENPEDQEENRISYVLPEGPLGPEGKELLYEHLKLKDPMGNYAILTQ